MSPAKLCGLWRCVAHIQCRFFREGLRQLLPSGIELVSGPGCPVCVTDQTYMDKALAYAEREDTIIATFGDMLKVPGSYSSLSEAQAKGLISM